jgi:hypothetical protein
MPLNICKINSFPADIGALYVIPLPMIFNYSEADLSKSIGAASAY